MPTRTPQPGDEQRRQTTGSRIRATRIQAGIGLRQMARDLGMSASWLLGVELGQHGIDAVRLADDGEGERARAHFELDRVFQRLEEARGGGGEGPAGGD
jgi:transcriptional regulator with XRE-family HTH domain